jgi:hypothetical protein
MVLALAGLSTMTSWYAPLGVGVGSASRRREPDRFEVEERALAIVGGGVIRRK